MNIILDQTIFYPQGGGQPSDIGTIKSITSSASFQVTMTRMADGIVEHEGLLENGEFKDNEEVQLSVDPDIRIKHARIHSGGHLLSHAAEHLNFPVMGIKGFHFPAGPYVEFKLTADSLDLSPSGISQLKQNWEEKCRQLITQASPITVADVQTSELDAKTLASLPEKAGSPDVVRFIDFNDASMPRPCGGTHISNTSEIGSDFTIKKITYKSNVLRVCYSMS